MRTLPLLLALVACAGTTSPDRADDRTNPVDPPDVADTLPDDASDADTDDVDLRGVSEHQPSGELVFSRDGALIYVLDVDNGDVVIVRREDRRMSTVHVGAEPTRLARRGDAVWVTVRGAGEVVRLREQDGGLVEEARRAVGAEPYDVVASMHSDKLFVSLSQEDAVVSLDPVTLAEVARWPVLGEPRWMAVTDPTWGSDEGVVVASAMRPTVTVLDPVVELSTVLELPHLPRFTHEDCDDRLLSRRITGELDLAWDGRAIYVPALYADTLVTQEPAFGDTATPLLPDAGCPQLPSDPGPRTFTGYGGVVRQDKPTQMARFEPAVVKLSLNPEVPTEVIHLGTVALVDDVVRTRRGYGAGLRVIRNELGDRGLWVTMETTGTLLKIDLTDPARGQERPPGFEVYERASAETHGGAVSPRVGPGQYGELWLLSWLDRQLEQHDPREFTATSPTGTLGRSDVLSRALPPSRLDPLVLEGRRLFYGADQREMTGPNTGTACANCHDEGRTDGFTWQFPDMPRQTPSLAGPVSATTPVTWTGEVATVGLEAELTTLLRMGGTGPDDDQKAAIEAFVDAVRAPIRPAPATPAREAQVALGAEVFRRPEVGCATCHVGALGTDQRQHALFGLPRVDTPRLQGVGATAPFLHDGSAATLRDVVLRARDGSMGDTSGLSDEELDALVAFLEHW